MSWPGNKTTLDTILGRKGDANAVRQSPEEIQHTMRRWAVVMGMAEASAKAVSVERPSQGKGA